MSTAHERVEPDSELSGEEKETTLGMLGMDEHMRMTSEKPTVVRSLLQHDHAEVVWVRGVPYGDDSIPTRTDDPSELEEIHAVSVELPVGCLTVKSTPRSNNHQSSIVTHETIDADAFEEE